MHAIRCLQCLALSHRVREEGAVGILKELQFAGFYEQGSGASGFVWILENLCLDFKGPGLLGCLLLTAAEQKLFFQRDLVLFHTMNFIGSRKTTSRGPADRVLDHDT